MDQDEEQFMIYIANLKVPEKSFYTLPWGQVVMMGCDQEGELLSFKNDKQYRNYPGNLWIQLQVVMFRDREGLYVVYACTECDVMNGVESLTMDTDRHAIYNCMCVHSRATMLLYGNWEQHWPELEDIPQEINAHRVFLRPEVTVIPALRTKDLFLGAFQESEKVHLLYSLTRAQKSLLCTKCTTRNCQCSKKYKSSLDSLMGENNEDSNELPWHREPVASKEKRCHYMKELTYYEYCKEHG